MKVYTYSEARQNLATLLDTAAREGAVQIRRRDGQLFLLKAEPPSASPLDVEGVSLDISADEIVAFVHEGRRPPPE
jgi:hypothetical protein